MEGLNCMEGRYDLLKKTGLIGDQRDVPYNPTFLKSGYSNVMIHRYESVIKLCTNKVVLDAGCGLGWGVDIIRKKAAMAIGIDCDPGAIKFSEETYLYDNVLFQVMDLTHITYQEGIFDVTLLMETLEHLTLDDGYKCISEIVRTLGPNGVIVGTTYISPTDRERQLHLQNSDNKDHLHIYTKYEMETLLSCFFYQHEIMGVTKFTAAFPKSSRERMIRR